MASLSSFLDIFATNMCLLFWLGMRNNMLASKRFSEALLLCLLENFLAKLCLSCLGTLLVLCLLLDHSQATVFKVYLTDERITLIHWAESKSNSTFRPSKSIANSSKFYFMKKGWAKNRLARSNFTCDFWTLNTLFFHGYQKTLFTSHYGSFLKMASQYW